MSGVATIEIKGLENCQAKIKVLADIIKQPQAFLNISMPHFVGAIKRNAEAGGRPEKWVPRVDGSTSHLHKDGYLMDIQGQVEGTVLKIRPGSAAKLYAGVHQFGATIKAKAKKYLCFKIGNRWSMKKEVKIPARPYLVIIDSELEKGVNIIRLSIQRAIDGAG